MPANVLDKTKLPAKLKFSSFIEVSKSKDAAGHTIAIDTKGIPHSYCHNPKTCDNSLGQLGRSGDPGILLPIKLQQYPDSNNNFSISHVYTGGFASSGHSALLDSNGNLWLSGCDRWQQLGLGSSNSGSSGYTWQNGKLWQDTFQKNEYIVQLIMKLDPSLQQQNVPVATTAAAVFPTSDKEDTSRRWIRDVALGGDHTVILSSNKKDVITFGKGGEGQLGLSSKPWVSSLSKSKVLSSSKVGDISAVCAYRNCSMTLNDTGEVMKTAGKCKGMERALANCIKRAKDTGLL